MFGCALGLAVCDFLCLFVVIEYTIVRSDACSPLNGHTTHEDKAGIGRADKLAVAAAASHQVPAEVVADARSRRQMVRQTQDMMVDILIERQKQKPLFAEEEPDRGSYMGEGGLDFDECWNYSMMYLTMGKAS